MIFFRSNIWSRTGCLIQLILIKVKFQNILAIHCADWASRGLNQSCYADVDPDGDEFMYYPVEVECDFDSAPGQALTILRE